MKKALFLILICSLYIVVKAQNTERSFLNNEIDTKKHKITIPYTPKVTFPNEKSVPKTEFITSSDDARENTVQNTTTQITPSTTILAKDWGTVKSVENNTNHLYQMNYVYGTGANVAVKIMNNDLTISKEFSFLIPNNCNLISMLSQTSNFNYQGNTNNKYLFFLHYFEGGTGANYQKNYVWIVDDNGTVVQKIDSAANALLFKNESDNSVRVLTYINNNTNYQFKVFDTQSFSQLSLLKIPSELFVNLAGNPINFIDVNGKPKLVINHYEKKYMDNSTLVTENNNHLLIKTFDYNLNLEKSVSASVPDKQADSNAFGFAGFGLPYNDTRYYVTNHTFNTDDKLEYTYYINYQDIVTDESWFNYFVVDEQGNTLKQMTDTILDYYPLNEVAGNDDQMGFITGTGLATSSYIKMFNIQSWNVQCVFPYIYEGTRFTTDFNRTADGKGSYQYLMTLGYGQFITDRFYGVINKYSATREALGNIKLDVGVAPYSFNPILSSDILGKKIFLNEEDSTYAYIYQIKVGSLYYNSFNLAKKITPPFFTVEGNATKGNILNSGFLPDENGIYDKLFVYYYGSSLPKQTIDIYNLPFLTTDTKNVLNTNTVKVFANNINHEISFSQKVKSFEVYNTVGQQIFTGKETEKITTNGWIAGVYVVKYRTDANAIETQRVFVR